MSAVTRYVVGFLFNRSMATVLLIQKKRGPANVVGKLNGVGGKIEAGETALEAMTREFKEEAGPIPGLKWNLYCVLKGEGCEVYFFTCASKNYIKAKAQTDEELHFVPVMYLQDEHVVPNVRWLVPMAVSLDCGEHAAGFVVQEGAEEYCHEVNPDGVVHRCAGCLRPLGTVGLCDTCDEDEP